MAGRYYSEARCNRSSRSTAPAESCRSSPVYLCAPRLHDTRYSFIHEISLSYSIYTVDCDTLNVISSQLFFFLMILRPSRSTLFLYTTLFFFFFKNPAPTDIYPLSPHAAFPF